MFEKIFRRWSYRSVLAHRVHDASLGHPRFEELLSLLKEGRGAAFDTVFASLPLDERHVILSGLAESSALGDVTSWHDSQTATAMLVLGTRLISRAWQARTPLAGRYVTTEGVTRFSQCLTQSFDCLVSAHEAEPENPEPLARLVRVLMGLQSSRDEIYECHERLIACPQHHVAGGYATVEALAPKWGGNAQEILSFARTRAAADARNQSLVPYAHIENWVSLTMSDPDGAQKYFSASDVAEEVAHANEADRLLREGGYFSLMARSVYAVCFYKLGDRERTRRELEMIAGRYPSKPWVYLSAMESAAVDEARVWCGLRAHN